MHLSFRIVVSACIVAAFCAQASSGQVSSNDARQDAERANEALKSGHPEKAIPEFQALVAANPDNADAQANLGVLLYFQGQPAKALEPLRAALRLNPDLPKIRALLGLSELQMGQSDAARNDLSNALMTVAEPKLRKQVGLSLVEVETAQHDLAGAAATIRDLRDKAPDDAEIEYAAYRIYSDLAGEALLSLSLTAPKSGQMQQAIAHELERVRDLPGAIASMRRAIAADPNLPGIHFELAEALHASDSPTDRAEAEHEYVLALEKNPHETQAAVRLGDLYADRSEWSGATKSYESVLSQQPNNVDASVGLARVYSERGDTANALPLLQTAVQTDPTNILAHFRLSALYRRLQRPDDATRELAEYQRLKQLKDDLRAVYSTMKLTSPGEHTSEDEPKNNPGVPH
jgi:tetratricopeptide (TPR) repeat protein